MELKHTLGPWAANDAGVVSLAGANVVCEAPIHYLDSRKNWDGNARLIAAAPDLLSALVEAVDLIETISPMEGDTLRRARAAIAKAVGHNV